MALQLIIGSSGSGKSYQMYQKLIKDSMECPDENFIVIVPEQYTMQTQKNIVAMHPKHGIMNIDILSFGRLAYRIFEEIGLCNSSILEDTGKRMVIRKILEDKRSELSVFSGSIRKSGFSGELKSAISELLQYNIEPQRLSECLEHIRSGSVLYNKLKDLVLIYSSFKDYINGHYLTAEEILTHLCPYIPQSSLIKTSRIYLDNFTGFTPSQYLVLEQLLKYSKGVQITLTIDIRSMPYEVKNNFELFYLTKDTVRRLEKLCMNIHCAREEDILLDGEKNGNIRFKDCEDLYHLEHYIYRKKSEVYSKNPEHLLAFSAKNPSHESTHVARQIRRLVRDFGYRYREIAVICADLDGYRHILEQAFDAMEIPCFIDMKRSVLHNAFVECLRAVLEIFYDNFSYESVFRYLRSGFSKISRDDIDLVENYVMAFGIRGAMAWKKTWMKRPDTMDDTMLLALNHIREAAFENLWPVYDVFNDKKTTVGERTQVLLHWIAQENMKEKLDFLADHFGNSGELSLEKEYTQVYDVVIELLKKYGEILSDEVVSIREYADILDAGFNEEKIGIIPPGIDQVTVGDIQRTRLSGVKVLFFMGVNEGIVPAHVKEGGLITDREKELLSQMQVELSPTTRQMSYFEQFYIYGVLSKASDFVYLSYSHVSSEGKALRPSTLLRRIRKIFPKLEIKQCEQDMYWKEWLDSESDAYHRLVEGFSDLEQAMPGEQWKELYSWFYKKTEYKEKIEQLLDAAFLSYVSRPLSQTAVKALYGNQLINSVTTLENYAACAYSHFLQYGLGLMPRAQSRIQTPDLGIILHQALEMFAVDIGKEGYTWKDVPEDVRERVSEACAEKAALSFGHTALLDTKRSQYQIRRLVRYVLRTTWAIKQQLARGDFLPEGFEIRFDSDALEGLTDVDLERGAVMKLKGTIDRIDLCEAGDNVYVKIVDYKSGQQKFDIAALYYGLSLQLVVYMNAARALVEKEHPGKKIIPAGILYYNIDDPLVEHSDFESVKGPEGQAVIDDELLVKLKSNGLINSSPEIIRLLDKDLSNDSSVIPVSMTASGKLSKRSSVASSRQFDQLGRFTSEKVKTLGQEILNGNIAVNPYIRGNKKACTYCLFRSVCEFDEKIKGFSYRRFLGMSADEVWEAIEKWNENREEE